ncbi:MAG: hypothetical protein NC293_09525 [Roseburia sp.]|nr:hypothetical protein [Roseburia sp.]
MKKIYLTFILVLCLFGIGIVGCNIADQNQDSVSQNTNRDSTEKENEEAGWLEDTPENVYQTMIDRANLAVKFDSYDDVIAASEFVVTGTVQKIKSYIKDTRILSNFRFQVETANGGTVKPEDIITIFTIGGKVKFAEYAEQEREFLVANSSEEELEKEIALHGDEYMESVYEGVPNIQEGDELVLCLGASDENEGAEYYIVGTSCFGQFTYDKGTGMIYKTQVEMQESGKRKLAKRMEIDEQEFWEKVEAVLG